MLLVVVHAAEMRVRLRGFELILCGMCSFRLRYEDTNGGASSMKLFLKTVQTAMHSVDTHLYMCKGLRSGTYTTTTDATK